MLKIYNNTNTPITFNIVVFEIGLNYVDEKLWASYSQDPAMSELVSNCSLLVNTHEDYFVYKGNIDFLFNAVTSNERLSNIKAEEDMEKRKKAIKEYQDSIENAYTELELFYDDFSQDIKTQKKYELIQNAIQTLREDIAKALKAKQ